ncbi:MAG: zf-HC2 domain-containing protein, partial [Firmicutes bacterium]|nr:zf-HC2 domain-containing protein [Bacillota bacterium]
MRMKCEVIKDLMPSYIDNLLSEDSQDLVEEHLAECETCKAYYETLKGDDDIFEAAAEELHVDEIQPLKKIKKKMNRKTLIVSLISVLCAAVVGYGVFFAQVHIDSYVPYEEAGITVSEDGKMYISEAFSGQEEYGYPDKHLRFFFVSDSFVTKNKKRSEGEAECYI